MALGEREVDTAGYKMREGRRFIGFTLGEFPDPEEAYATFETPKPSRLALTAKRHVAQAYREAAGEASGAEDVFLYGMSDVARLVIPALARHASIPKEQALEIASSHGTVMAHALGARLASDASDALIFNRPSTAFAVNPHQTSIEIIDPTIEPNPVKGCEAVRIIDGELVADPIFEKFSIWAGQLAVHAHFNHNR